MTRVVRHHASASPFLGGTWRRYAAGPRRRRADRVDLRRRRRPAVHDGATPLGFAQPAAVRGRGASPPGHALKRRRRSFLDHSRRLLPGSYPPAPRTSPSGGCCAGGFPSLWGEQAGGAGSGPGLALVAARPRRGGCSVPADRWTGRLGRCSAGSSPLRRRRTGLTSGPRRAEESGEPRPAGGCRISPRPPPVARGPRRWRPRCGRRAPACAAAG